MEDTTQNIVMKEIEKTLRMLHDFEKKIKQKNEDGENNKK